MHSALRDWPPSRITRIAVSAVAVFLAPRLTDGFLTGVGTAVGLAVALDVPWWLYGRYVARDE